MINTNGQRTPQQDQRPPAPPPIASEKLSCNEQGKDFFLDVKENQRGRVLVLTERIQSSGRRDRVMIPMEVSMEVARLMSRLAEWSEVNP